jgi:hypothetical protein
MSSHALLAPVLARLDGDPPPPEAWRPCEDKDLLRALADNQALADIACDLGRPIVDIEYRLLQLVNMGILPDTMSPDTKISIHQHYVMLHAQSGRKPYTRRQVG